MWETFQNWFMNLGAEYNVNPFIFGGIYLGAIPLFSFSIAWLIRNYRRGESIIMPVISAIFFFTSAYIYLIIVGKNVPFWVYGAVVLLIVFGAYSTIKNIRRKIREIKISE
jgi:hypothetical protein